MAYEMVMPYHLHMPSYFLETFTEYPYSAGFKPDIEWNEYDLTQNPTDALLPLGDPDEFMLGKAISLITGINRSARSMNTLSQPIMRGESVYQSTERHATGGMLMVPEEKNN